MLECHLGSLDATCGQHSISNDQKICYAKHSTFQRALRTTEVNGFYGKYFEQAYAATKLPGDSHHLVVDKKIETKSKHSPLKMHNFDAKNDFFARFCYSAIC